MIVRNQQVLVLATKCQKCRRSVYSNQWNTSSLMFPTYFIIFLYGCFHKSGCPPNGWFIMVKTITMDDDWGHLYFRTPPHLTPWDSHWILGPGRATAGGFLPEKQSVARHRHVDNSWVGGEICAPAVHLFSDVGRDVVGRCRNWEDLEKYFTILHFLCLHISHAKSRSSVRIPAAETIECTYRLSAKTFPLACPKDWERVTVIT